jgi:hypothetical protein
MKTLAEIKNIVRKGRNGVESKKDGRREGETNGRKRERWKERKHYMVLQYDGL